jgi:hypothetical protein
MTTEFLVRLKPRTSKRRKGVPLTPERYMIRGVRFDEERGWYRITDAEFAEQLRGLTHNDREDGVQIFDVCTAKEAAALQDREKRTTPKRSVEDANALNVESASRVTPRGARELRGGAVTRADAVFSSVGHPPSKRQGNCAGNLLGNLEARHERAHEATPVKSPPPMIDGADGEEDEGWSGDGLASDGEDFVPEVGQIGDAGEDDAGEGETGDVDAPVNTPAPRAAGAPKAQGGPRGRTKGGSSAKR